MKEAYELSIAHQHLTPIIALASISIMT